jgi:hypothetical protein
LKIGDTLFNLHPSSPRHLWVLAAGPTDEAEFVMFNLTSMRDGCDKSCVIQPGEHVHVHHPTVVAYMRGQIVTDIFLQSLGSLCSWQQPVSQPLLERIQQGALDSYFTKQRQQAIVRRFLVGR